MADDNSTTIYRAGSIDRVEEAPPRVIRAAQQASEAQGQGVRAAEEATRESLRAGAEMLNDAGEKARTAGRMSHTPEAKQGLLEWAGLPGRVFARNYRALIDVMECRSIGEVMGRQT